MRGGIRIKLKNLICALLVIFLLPLNYAAAESIGDYAFSNDYGDYLYFDSTAMNNASAQYENFAAADNANYISLGRLDYKNIDRSDWIYMEKSTDDECALNITLKKKSNAYSSRTYDYYLIEGSFMSDIFTADLRFSLSGGKAVAQADVSVGEYDLSDWTDIRIYADIPAKRATLSVGGEVKKTVNLGNIPSLGAVGVQLAGKRGNMYIDKLRITGLVNPCDGGETKADIFGDYADEKAFLKGKYAVCGGIDRLLKGSGDFINAAHTPFFEDGDVYISADDFYALFGTAADLTYAKTADGVAYVPTAALAKERLGKKAAVHAAAELAVVSDCDINLAGDGWQNFSQRVNTRITQLNGVDFIVNYMTFERPSAERLLSDFALKDAHPRIMLTADRVDGLKRLRRDDAVFADLTEKFLADAEGSLGDSVAQYVYADNLRMKSEADRCVKRMKNWGLAWNLTGESKYVERAWQDLKAIADFPDYNLATIHDIAEFNTALAIGYDWLYNGLSAERREYIENAVLNHSLKPLADGYYGRIFAGDANWSTFKWAGNLNAVADSGAILAAAAVFDRDAEYCADVISKAVRSLEYTMIMFDPGGGWSEGPGYWNYAMSYLCCGMETLRTVFGSDYGLSGARGFCDTADFYYSLEGESGLNNFGDTAAITSRTVAVYSVMSDITGDSFLGGKRIETLAQSNLTPSAEDIVYYPSSRAAADGQPDRVVVTKGAETFCAGVGAQDGEMYFSTHFGRTGGYHAHNDTGTFVLDMLGERWAEDLGSESYAPENFGGYKEWQIYRKRAEGHNCLVINPSADGYEQRSDLFVPIASYGGDSSSAYVSADLSAVYDAGKSVLLSYSADLEQNTLECEYEINLDAAADAYWFMHTKADIAIDGDTAVLTRNGKSVGVDFEVIGADSHSLGSMDAVSLFDELRTSAQNQNSGYGKLVLKLHGKGSISLRIKISPR